MAKKAPKKAATAATLASARAMLAAAKKRTCANERGDYAAYAVEAAIGAKAPLAQKARIIREGMKLVTGCKTTLPGFSRVGRGPKGKK